MEKLDYYIFVDYSGDLIGHVIIDSKKVSELIQKISRFAHYRNLKHKDKYIKSIKERIKKENILSYILRTKIRKLRDNLEIYSDVIDFVKKHNNCSVFISVDDKQYLSFKKIIDTIDGKNVTVVQESKLKKHSKEDRMSLIIDTLLNIKRLKDM
ncbi:MAG: hypothetical protein AABY07_01525 [Nanoarchaeota archaeon]